MGYGFTPTSKLYRYEVVSLSGGMYRKSTATGGHSLYYVYDGLATRDGGPGGGDSASQIGDVQQDNFTSADIRNNTKVGQFIGTTSDRSGFLALHNGKKYLYKASGAADETFTVNGTPYTLMCFTTGTHIRTTRGDVAVEALRAGDMVVTASGAGRPIRWLGHRALDCAGAPDRRPVRIVAGAFGPAVPARDLLLSPGHPVLVGADADGEGGHLVPIMCLINGTTIARATVDTVTYWHVELDAHDILLAENLPAESYLEWGDRGFFAEGVDHALANPDFVAPGLAGRCRPVAFDGPVVDAERRRLNAVFSTGLAATCAWPSEATLAFE